MEASMRPLSNGGLAIHLRSKLAFCSVEWDAAGNVVKHAVERYDRPASLPPQPIPADYDPHDKSNFRSCCDPPTE